MPLLSSCYLPGIYAEDHSIDVPLDWRGTSPAALAGAEQDEPSALAMEGAAERPDSAFVGKSIKLFYRVLCSPENVGRDLPLIVFFQGGPGGACPASASPQSDGDRGGCATAWSCPTSAAAVAPLALTVRALPPWGPRLPRRARTRRVARRNTQAIPCGLNHQGFRVLRLTEFGGRKWVTLGQSWRWISPQILSASRGVAASFTCGGIPMPASAAEVYAHTFPRMAAKTRAYYERYPEDETRVSLVADRLAAGDVLLPDGSPFSVRRLQLVGGGLGMKPAPERLHALFDVAFADGDGSCDDALAAAGGDASHVRLFGGFLDQVQSMTSSYASPLYWTLQEFIYADGTLDEPIGWAAAREAAGRSEFSEGASPHALCR